MSMNPISEKEFNALLNGVDFKEENPENKSKEIADTFLNFLLGLDDDNVNDSEIESNNTVNLNSSDFNNSNIEKIPELTGNPFLDILFAAAHEADKHQTVQTCIPATNCFNPDNIDLRNPEYIISKEENYEAAQFFDNIAKLYNTTVTCKTITGWTICMQPFYMGKGQNGLRIKTLEDDSEYIETSRERFINEFPMDIFDKSSLVVKYNKYPDYHVLLNDDWSFARPATKVSYDYQLGDIIIAPESELFIAGIETYSSGTSIIVELDNYVYRYSAAELSKYLLLRKD